MNSAVYAKEKMVSREEKDSLITCIKAVFLYGVILIMLILTGSFEADADELLIPCTGINNKNIKYNNYYSRLYGKSRSELNAMGYNQYDYSYYDGTNINDRIVPDGKGVCGSGERKFL